MTRHVSVEASRSDEEIVDTPAMRHGRSLISLLLLIALGIVGYNFYFLCARKQANYEAKLEETDRLESEIAVLKQQNKILSERVNYLKTDAGVEEVAREKLGLVRKDEVAFVVVPAMKEDAPDAPVYVPKPPPRKPTFMQKALHSIFEPGFPYAIDSGH